MNQSSDQSFQVGPDQHGHTLEWALKHWLAGHSWGQVRRLLAARRVLIHGNLCLDGQRRVSAGERVEVRTHSLRPLPGRADVVLLHVDRHLVVAQKPAGILAVRHRQEKGISPRRKRRQPTLDEIVWQLLRDSARAARSNSTRSSSTRANPSSIPPVRSVHRLDRDTSGLMVLARSEQAEQDLREQFRSRSAQRVYQAVVAGHPAAQTLVSRLVRDRGDGLRGSLAGEQSGTSGQQAITHIRPLESLGTHSLIECRLETGRTHQIRIQLAELGHPVCGDKLYRGPFGQPPIADTSGAPRQALHATQLAFVHPVTRQSMQFVQPLPGDLRRLVERLRRSQP